ncbi:hypothetical protein [Halomonas urumqiensis]|uniref:Uncharacterized protein n=1 Tax=Halomonas urumqiensis TaxID=1684789 RepID=A0A2N7UPY5_9GAMM|nr:hypothetical protein [Halomonas urumqiensis]PMR82471.1 hypothetical protein C1H70_01775 [Halomonas urumqiensis]PTB04048.1 hypothetical protein C6V82_06225 [Halomonas urumqiensis]
MAYVLVMGGLALSVFFTFGWMLLRTSQWLWQRRPGSSKKADGTRKPAAKVQPRPRTPPQRKAAARSRDSTKAAGKPAAATVKASGEPWGLTRWLSRRRSALPLSFLATLLYGLARLAEFGITQRSHDAPAPYHALVAVLGWIAAVLLAVALVNLLARWRCRPR